MSFTEALRLSAGAVVMELLPYNWEWKGISRTYANLTASCGHVHHVAWRAKHPRSGLASSGFGLRAQPPLGRGHYHVQYPWRAQYPRYDPG